MNKSALFSSSRDDWVTPHDFFERLNHIFNFRLDAAATAENAKCDCYFTRQDDALSHDWYPYGRIWLNPPYGRGLERWMRKAYEESEKGCLVVCLVCVRTDTKWWHEWVKDKAWVTFIRRRLRFSHPIVDPKGKGSSVFPVALVVYGMNFDAIFNGPEGAHLGRGGHHVAGDSEKRTKCGSAGGSIGLDA